MSDFDHNNSNDNNNSNNSDNISGYSNNSENSNMENSNSINSNRVNNSINSNHNSNYNNYSSSNNNNCSNNNSSSYNSSSYNNSNYNNSSYNNSSYNNSNYNNSNYNTSNYNNNDNVNRNNMNYNNSNNNQEANRDNSINSQNQYHKVPEYSFWAEQVPNTTYSNYNPNPNNNTWQQGNNSQNRDIYSANKNKRDEKSKVRNSTGMKVFKFIAKSVGFGLIAGISFLGFQQIYGMINPNSSSNALKDILEVTSGEKTYEIGLTQTGNVKVVDNSTVSDVTKNTLPSIVSINSTSTQTSEWFGQAYDQEVQGSGSGIIVGENDKELLIATNNHVVEGTNKITVTFADGSEADAQIKGTDAAADLAVVAVDISTVKQESLDAIAVAKLGNSDEVKVGEMVVAIGNALGYGQSVTVGYISAKDREVQVSDGYDTKNMVLLQTDAAINPGNSGGALLNVNGEVIGINTVKYASNEVEGMGYAIPISRAFPIITELMNREILSQEEQGYLGIAGNDVTEEIASYYSMPVGVFVNELVPGGAAEKAGLQSGDIITVADELDITSISQLREYVNSRRVGTEVEITYMRNANGKYEEGKVTVTLGKNPSLTE